MLLSPSAVAGGAERAFVNLARNLPASGFATSALLLGDGVLREWLEEAGCVVTVLSTGRTRNAWRTAATIRTLRRHAAQADIVVSNQSKGHVFGGAAAALAHRPAIWWQQGVPSSSNIERVAARVPCAAIVCSSRDAELAQMRLTPQRQVSLIHLGVEVEQVTLRRGSGEALRRDVSPRNQLVVGIVGRLEPWKGQETFLRAAALVVHDRPDAVFLIVGGALLGWEGDYPERLKRLAAELGLAGHVHFTGHQDDVYPWFDAMDVVVHASQGEPFGLVLVEAMALGKPLVAAASGGPLEIVEDGKSGLLVPSGDARGLAAALVRLLDDAGLRADLGRNAVTRAGDFSAQRMSQKFAALLASTLAAHAGRR